MIRNGDVLGSGDIRWGQLPIRALRTLEIERARIVRDDIVLTTSGDCGYVAHVGAEPTPTVCATNFVRALHIDEKRAVSRYIFHFMNRDRFRVSLSPFIRGTTMKNLAVADALAHSQVPLPPLPEQRRICELLDATEALRAKRRVALKLLGTVTRGSFIEMFGDPTTNPKSWPTRALGEVGTLDRGVSKHRPRNAPELLGGPHPLVQTGEVANCDGYVREHKSTYTDLGLEQSKMWVAGTLCITIAANIAKGGILTFDACFPDSVVGFSADNPATVEFVRTWLTFHQQRLENAAPESAQKNINLAILRALQVPFPPIELQREFAGRVAAIEKLKALHRASLARLDELFASLQHRAFRGEL